MSGLTSSLSDIENFSPSIFHLHDRHHLAQWEEATPPIHYSIRTASLAIEPSPRLLHGLGNAKSILLVSHNAGGSMLLQGTHWNLPFHCRNHKGFCSRPGDRKQDLCCISHCVDLLRGTTGPVVPSLQAYQIS